MQVPSLHIVYVENTEPVLTFDVSQIDFSYTTPCGTPLRYFSKLTPADIVTPWTGARWLETPGFLADLSRSLLSFNQGSLVQSAEHLLGRRLITSMYKKF